MDGTNDEIKGNRPARALLVIYSYHHNNTEKVAEIIAGVLEAQVRTPTQIKQEEIDRSDLVGFGSGIDSGEHYREMLDFADGLPEVRNKDAFIFSTAGVTGERKREKDHSALREILRRKGYNVIDEFQCKGYNTNSFLKYLGGMNKGRPNSEDLGNAERFARNMRRDPSRA